MYLKFEARTQSNKLTKEAVLSFLTKCNNKHLQAAKFDYKEPCKNIYNKNSPEEVYELFKKYTNFIIKGKNGFYVSVWNYAKLGITSWSGGITIKNIKKTDEISSEITALLSSLCVDEQFLFGSIYTESEHDIKHKVITNFAGGGRSIGWEGVSNVDFLKYFPGIYRTTIFGKRMYEHIGENNFSNIPDVTYADIPDEAIVIKLQHSLNSDDDEEKIALQRKIANHIGSTFFFDIENKDIQPSYPDSLKQWLNSLKSL